MNTEQSYVGRGTNATLPPQAAQNGPQILAAPDNRQHQPLINPTTGELTESWEPFPLYDLERFYEVSDAGRIRNLATGAIARTFYSKNGTFFNVYHPVTLKFICVQVKRAVALAFIPNPNGLPWVRQKNGIKSQNQATNLEWAHNNSTLKKIRTQSFADFILDRLIREGRLTELERLRAGIVAALDDSMAPQIGEGTQFIAVPVSPNNYSSLVGKVVAVVVKAKLFAYYLGRVVSIDEDFVRVSRDNLEWPERTESRAVIASIARVVSVLETSVS